MKKKIAITVFAAIALFGAVAYLHANSNTHAHPQKDIQQCGMRCTFCNGTGFRGNFNCTLCNGTGRNASY